MEYDLSLCNNKFLSLHDISITRNKGLCLCISLFISYKSEVVKLCAGFFVFYFVIISGTDYVGFTKFKNILNRENKIYIKSDHV